MKILSIDTSSDICSVAILEDESLIKELNINDKKTHSENLMPLINQLLEVAELEPKNISIIACNVGPGSFTGIRIGISSCKAIAEVLNIPVVGISSLEGLAYNEYFEGIICVLIDCRNDNVYGQIFETVNTHMAPFNCSIHDALKKLKNCSNIMFVGTRSCLA